MKDYLDNLYSEYLKLEEKAWRRVNKQCLCTRPGSEPECITCPFSISMRRNIRCMMSEEYFPPLYISIEDDDYYEVVKEFCAGKSVVTVEEVYNYLKDRFSLEGYCQLDSYRVKRTLNHLGYKSRAIKFYLDEARYCPTVYYLDEESLNRYRKEKREAFNEQHHFDEAKFKRSFKAVEEYCKDKKCFFAEDIYRHLVYETKPQKAYKKHINIALEELGYKRRRVEKMLKKRCVARIVYYFNQEDLRSFVDNYDWSYLNIK